MKKRLLAVQGPQQFIAGLIAMEWYGEQTAPEEHYYSVLLMYDFMMPSHLEQDFVNVINALAATSVWQKKVFICGADMGQMMRGPYLGATEKLRNYLGETAFDEVHIGRDFCGDGSPLILNAFPNSTRILYGDAFGLVGNEALSDVFNWRTPFQATLDFLKLFVKKTVYGTHRKLAFDTAVLTLPLDWSGHYLDKLPLMVPSKDFVTTKVGKIGTSLAALNAYQDVLVANSEQKYLFLLSNLSASGYMDEDAEIELYCEIIIEIAPSDTCIFLKAHPRAHEKILNAVVARLRNRYENIKIIDDVKLSMLPVELWVKLLRQSTIVPIFSTSAINLKYLYGQAVVLPLTRARMKKYCYYNKYDSLAKGNQIISESVNNLSSWDNQSVLWRGQ